MPGRLTTSSRRTGKDRSNLRSRRRGSIPPRTTIRENCTEDVECHAPQVLFQLNMNKIHALFPRPAAPSVREVLTRHFLQAMRKLKTIHTARPGCSLNRHTLPRPKRGCWPRRNLTRHTLPTPHLRFDQDEASTSIPSRNPKHTSVARVKPKMVYPPNTSPMVQPRIGPNRHTLNESPAEREV